MGIPVVLLVFLIITLVVLIALFVVVIVGAIIRLCESKPPNEEQMVNKRNKVVDLFVTRVSDLPRSASHKQILMPGMTALVDLGMFNLETGIYMLQSDAVWIKIAVPDVGDRFTILRGEHAKRQHTIRASFANEVRTPSETQVVTSENTYQVLDESTSKICVQDDIKTAAQIAVNQNQTHHAHNATNYGRTLMIVNASPTFKCVLVFKPFAENVIVEPTKIAHVHMTLTCNVNGTYFYQPLAT